MSSVSIRLRGSHAAGIEALANVLKEEINAELISQCINQLLLRDVAVLNQRRTQTLMCLLLLCQCLLAYKLLFVEFAEHAQPCHHGSDVFREFVAIEWQSHLKSQCVAAS